MSGYSTNGVRVTKRRSWSTLEEGELTHVGALQRVIVNATLTPDPHGDGRPPVVHFLVHGGDGEIAFGITTDDAEDLIRAGDALVRAGNALRERHWRWARGVVKGWRRVT